MLRAKTWLANELSVVQSAGKEVSHTEKNSDLRSQWYRGGDPKRSRREKSGRVRIGPTLFAEALKWRGNPAREDPGPPYATWPPSLPQRGDVEVV